MSEVFDFYGAKLPYARFPSPPHWDWLDNSERVVEVAIGKYLLDSMKVPPARVLEFGNVLPQYLGYNDHTVVDKGDAQHGAIARDILDYHPERTFDLILSLSTIEHVGFDEGFGAPPDPTKVRRALSHLVNLLSPTGTLIVAWPLGWNAALDADYRAGLTPLEILTCLRRLDAANHWAEATYAEVKDVGYGAPFPLANALVVARVRN